MCPVGVDWLREMDPGAYRILGVNPPAPVRVPAAPEVPLRSVRRVEDAVPRWRPRRRLRDGRVVLRTVMSKGAFEVLSSQGWLSGRPPGPDDDNAAAYGWMRWQMQRRLPGYRGEFPVWAWRGGRRWEMLSVLDGCTGILVTHAAHEQSIVSSREGLFACVLNGNPLLPDGLDQDGEDAFFDRWHELVMGVGCGVEPWWRYPLPVLRELLSTWEEIVVDTPGSKRLLQACVPVLWASDVLHAVALPGRAAEDRRTQ